MSELKKCSCDYKSLQSFATRSIPASLNVHEVFSFISSSEFKPFIERPCIQFYHSFFWKKKMEGITEKLDEADDIAEVIDLMQNLSIPTKGCKNIEDMKKEILAHLSSRKDKRVACDEVGLQGNNSISVNERGLTSFRGSS